MKSLKYYVLAALCAPSILFAANFIGNNTYASWADEAVTQAWTGLNACGLTRLNAYDPRLPRPQVPATDAVVNSRGIVLAYAYDTAGLFFPAAYTFKNPNGGYAHVVTYSAYGMSFNTPYGGTVAGVTWVNSGAGPYQQFSCRGQLIPGQSFYACVKTYWIDVIVNQLCRFPG